ncbi:hypothetical protein [Paraburkholderia ferrariae]|jgi:hypothetical protein|nr:hypothetical protein [Paraburkholderia ferrariae]
MGDVWARGVSHNALPMLARSFSVMYTAFAIVVELIYEIQAQDISK